MSWVGLTSSAVIPSTWARSPTAATSPTRVGPTNCSGAPLEKLNVVAPIVVDTITDSVLANFEKLLQASSGIYVPASIGAGEIGIS